MNTGLNLHFTALSSLRFQQMISTKHLTLKAGTPQFISSWNSLRNFHSCGEAVLLLSFLEQFVQQVRKKSGKIDSQAKWVILFWSAPHSSENDKRQLDCNLRITTPKGRRSSGRSRPCRQLQNTQAASDSNYDINSPRDKPWAIAFSFSDTVPVSGASADFYADFLI